MTIREMLKAIGHGGCSDKSAELLARILKQMCLALGVDLDLEESEG